MVYFTLQLTSNESTFEYSFPQEFLDKNFEIALIKLDGNLEISDKININYTNNRFYYNAVSGVDQNNNPINEEKVIDIPNGKHISENKFNSKTINDVFILCNLINDSYVNNKKMNSIYRFRLDDGKIGIEARQIIYHKVTNRSNKIILKLVDINNNLIDVNNVNLFVELNMREIP
jgi:hypothetical protein